MPFPLSLVESFEVEAPGGASEQSVLLLKTAVLEWLDKHSARAISQTRQGISFKAGMFRFVTGMNLLLAISSGDIEFTRNGDLVRVNYILRFNELLKVTTVGVALLVVFQAFMMGSFDPGLALFVFTSGWLWLFGMNYVLAKYRVRYGLRKIARQTIGGNVS